MTGKIWGLMAALLLLVGGEARAYERDAFLQHQYRTQCMAFAEDPEGFRQRLATGTLPQLPEALVRQLLMGQEQVQGWSLAFQGRREYVLVLTEDEGSCAIVARYADSERTREWFEQLVTAPPDGYTAERLMPGVMARRHAGEALIERWVWQGANRSLEHQLMISTKENVQIKAIVSLTLTTKTE